ncbi:MAG: ABC transporter permease [Chloroflexi bacterium]|nr:ABC transporter permease [Chloroflexota bacterium]
MQQEAMVRGELRGKKTVQFRQGSALRQLWETNLEVFQRDKLALLGLFIFAFFTLVAVFAPLIAPNDPLTPLKDANGDWIKDVVPYWMAVPGEDEAEGYVNTFHLGTTNIGRDIFSQLIYGSRAALLVGFSAAIAVAVIGTVVGLLAGYYGGWIDTLLMRAADVAFGIPFIPFIIVISAFFDPSIWNVVVAMAVLLWRDSSRVIRSQVLVIKEQAFVSAAKVSGASELRIIFVYIAPSILPLSFLYGTLAIAWAILTEASVSFLGFSDPDTISWGYMLQDAFNSLALSREAFYWIVPPGLCIMLTVMAGFFIGRGYEEVLFPRLRRM